MSFASAPVRSHVRSHMGGRGTYLEYLDAQGDAVPVGRAVDVLGGVDVQQELECVEPCGEDGLCGFFDCLWMLLLHHEQRLDARPEDPYSTCPSEHAMLLHIRPAFSEFYATRQNAVVHTSGAPRMLSRIGSSCRNTGRIWSSVKSALMNSAMTCIAPCTD